VCACVCVCACMHACVRASACARPRACACVLKMISCVMQMPMFTTGTVFARALWLAGLLNRPSGHLPLLHQPRQRKGWVHPAHNRPRTCHLPLVNFICRPAYDRAPT
jgi:hypothetical protein